MAESRGEMTHRRERRERREEDENDLLFARRGMGILPMTPNGTSVLPFM